MVKKACAAAVATSKRSACLYARHLQRDIHSSVTLMKHTAVCEPLSAHLLGVCQAQPTLMH